MTNDTPYKEILLPNGTVAIVDSEDYGLVSGHKWRTWISRGAPKYPSTSIQGQTVTMHRLIMGVDLAKLGLQIDHVDGDGFNNRKSNLRVATRSQNQINRGMTRRNTSGYKGVQWDKARSRWIVQLDSITIGRFHDKLEAARAYDKAAVAKYGEFAKINGV